MFTKHLIIQFLIVNILFSNFAWAVDECGYLFSLNNEQTNVQYDQAINTPSISKTNGIYEVNNPTDKNDINSCDINCSANVRLLFVSFSFPFVQYTEQYSSIISLESPYHSIQPQPPVKPPKV